MNEQRKDILDMLAEGKITAERGGAAHRRARTGPAAGGVESRRPAEGQGEVPAGGGGRR